MIIPLYGYVAVIEDPQSHATKGESVTVSGKIIATHSDSDLPEGCTVVFNLEDALHVLLNCQTEALLVQEMYLLAILPSQPLEEEKL